jgi:glutamine amidotransferase
VIVIVDYGVGNLGALINMLDFLGFECMASRDAREIERADKLVLPGVGAFDRAMRNLRNSGLVAPLEEAVRGRTTPVLGVCLGMQLLGKGSEEGIEAGLGWIDATSIRISPPLDSGLKVPHIGWSEVSPRNHSPLFEGSTANSRFYFVHSYHVLCLEPKEVAAVVVYGDELCCAVSAGNVHGVQFHPEKSHRHGMALLKSFIERT